MFRQRTSSQKPGDDLLANFRQQFPEVAGSPTTVPAQLPNTTTSAVDNGAIPAAAPGQERTQSISHPVFPDQDPTPRASTNEPWRFTPSLLDPGAFSFSSFPNGNTGFYAAQTPGGNNTLFHPQAGDLHTPTMGLGMSLNTPLSMPAADGSMHPGTATATMMDVSAAGFHNGLHPQAFHAYHPFAQPAAQQPSFAPSSFVHHDPTALAMDPNAATMNGAHPGAVAVAVAPGYAAHPGLVAFPPGQHPHAFNGTSVNVANMAMLASLPPTAEKFRFHTTLNAPTAMIKQADEIPVSYLNKGQAYSISIIDTEPELPILPGTRFRTYVRISFEDEQQRQKPGVCWSLWKEGRGTNEAHQRGGKLQAVEYVEAGQPPEGDEKRTRVELESASFDGFSVVWTPGIHGAVECNIAVRFNFLSTDFSHSKGVKGIPVRLCTKTTRYPAPHQQSSASPKDSSSPTPEICFCKVKLFRDHGAERKLSNDVAHVKKTIEKLKQQIAQAESGMKDFKRKRSGGAAVSSKPTPDLQRVGKVPKHKRTWSMSSTSSNGNGNGSGTEDGSGGNSSSGTPIRGANGVRPAVEEDLHCKLQTLQDMFTSTRPVSILYLRGDELDDPDLHPVSLPGENGSLTKVESRDNLMSWRDQSGRSSVTGSSMVSPSPSSLSLHSQVSYGGGINGNSNTSNGWSDYHGDSLDPHRSSRQSSNQPTRINKTDDAGNLSGWIEALDVDSSYRPMQSDRPKAVACFYVLRRNKQNSATVNGSGATANGTHTPHELHRALYVTKKTLHEFVGRITAKWNLDPTKVARTVRVLPQGLEVEMDDDAVAELPEGQDMVLDVVERSTSTQQENGVKAEWDQMAVDTDGAGSRVAYELRLSF
ncbi:hypothetical protein SEUCBS139899_000454 [Sporothrix eucalyptigena]|uniref:Grh/CP2 DB domain-containing protein n=1 Tax=Sporothrix eucalyptigena TaxID=1812306 RepID=A0ABP0BC00_9PEZI